MLYWGATALLVWFAYWLGFRQGQADVDRKLSRYVNAAAFRLGVPGTDSFWENPEEIERTMLEIKHRLEEQINQDS